MDCYNGQVIAGIFQPVCCMIFWLQNLNGHGIWRLVWIASFGIIIQLLLYLASWISNDLSGAELFRPGSERTMSHSQLHLLQRCLYHFDIQEIMSSLFGWKITLFLEVVSIDLGACEPRTEFIHGHNVQVHFKAYPAEVLTLCEDESVKWNYINALKEVRIKLWLCFLILFYWSLLVLSSNLVTRRHISFSWFLLIINCIGVWDILFPYLLTPSESLKWL